MTLDRRLVKEACQELWNECHERIETLGYTLGKDSMMHGPKEISIIATIQPEYSSEMIAVFREIIPSRRTKRSLIGTIATLIVVLFLINYLLELSKVGQ